MAASARGRSAIAGAAQRVSAGIVFVEVTAISVIFAFMVYAVFTQVVTRYVLDEPSPWTEESARYGFVWLSMLGAALGVRRQSHFGFDVAVRALPVPLANVAGKIASAIIFSMVALLAWQGWKLMQLESFSTGPATNVPMIWIYAAIPTGSVLIMAHIILEFLGAKPERAPASHAEEALAQATHDLDAV
jgi:TRAP-type transport system small permease protein